jgi:CheY-like chemotaxis protein
MSQAMVLNTISGSQVRDKASSEKTGAKTRDRKLGDHPKIVLIDDDPVYGAVIGRWAELEGVEMDVFNSLDDLGFVGLLSQYDVAIVDYDLGEINGKDVADYMTTLFGNKPMVMISVIDRSKEMMNCPSCVKAFMKKSAGYEKILNTALKLRMKAKAGGQ